MRPGTVATALAVGFGVACEIAAREMEADAEHAAALSARFMDRLRHAHPWLVVNGSMDRRVPHNLSVSFPGVDADALVASVPDLAISTGSACSAGALNTSHVLAAIVPAEIADGTIRIGFGRKTTIGEVDAAAAMVVQAVAALAAGSNRKVG